MVSVPWKTLSSRKVSARRPKQLQPELSTAKFEPFPRLPLELRREIWNYALLVCLSEPAVCVLSSPQTGLAAQLTPTREVQNPHTALRAVNTEARQVALETPFSRDYNPQIDILYIPSGSFRSFTGNECRINKWVAEIRHLALALPVADSGLWLPYAMEELEKLESISIVYPKATGVVDVDDDVKLPSQERLKLRKLSDEEAKGGLKIHADYVYDTWAGGIPIQWIKSPEEHLAMVKADLNRKTMPGNLSVGRTVPCWDQKAKCLKLRFEARCFD